MFPCWRQYDDETGFQTAEKVLSMKTTNQIPSRTMEAVGDYVC